MKRAYNTLTLARQSARKVRVVIVAPYGQQTMGGQATFATRLADQAARRVDVVRLVIPQRRERYRLSRIVCSARLACRLVWLLLRRRVDVVHVFSPCSRMALFEKLVLTGIARALGAKTILNFRNGLDQWSQYWGRLERRIVVALIRVNTIVLCQYRALAEYLVAEGMVGREQVRVVANGLPAAELIPHRSTGHGAARTRIVFLGSVGIRKGVDLLVHAARLLDARAGRPFVVEIVGPADNGREIRAIERSAQPLVAKGGLKFRGPISPGERRELLGGADIFVLFSRAEGLPNSLLEAMGASLPVVVSDRGAMPEVVESGVEGLVVAAEDAAQLADALGTLIDDPQLRRQMGRRARQRVESHYALEQVVSEFCHLYENLHAPRVRQHTTCQRSRCA
ncbi:MAG: glycosyltransferase family 4 protein [Pirellulales bacterium]